MKLDKWSPVGEREQCEQDAENQDPGVISDDEERVNEVTFSSANIFLLV